MSARQTRKSGLVRSDYPSFPIGFAHLPGYLGIALQRALSRQVEAVVASAPLYRPSMPRTGKPFSIEMTNCGPLGWVSDKEGGYRYQSTHPSTGRSWPPIPQILVELWREVAAYPEPPEACLVNHYVEGTRLGSHIDSDEEEFNAPVVSVSLGDEATFHIGGAARTAPKQRILLRSGDVVILAGEARLAYHGIDRIHPGSSDVVERGGRFNLTLRRVTRSLTPA